MTTVKQEPCTRCGTKGEGLLVIRANYPDSKESAHPLCDECLRKLGEWVRQAESEENSDL